MPGRSSVRASDTRWIIAFAARYNLLSALAKPLPSRAAGFPRCFIAFREMVE